MVFDALEKQGWAAASPTRAKRWLGRGALVVGSSLAFAYAVGDFGNFEDGIDFGLDAFEFAGAVERGDPLAEVGKGQGCLPKK